MLADKWFMGHLQMECCSWTAADVTDAAYRFRGGDWPCDVLIIDCQAHAGVFRKDGGFEWAERFGDYRSMFSTIKAMNFKTCISSAMQGRNLYNWPEYDPTLKEATDKYWETIVHKNIDGIDFWRQDNSERYPKHTKNEFFRNGYESHNLFGSLWAKNVVEKMQQMDLYGRPVISRGGPIGGHRYILPWAGDLPHGIKYLPVDLSWLRNGGLSGYAFIAVDSGGFKGPEPLEEYNVIRRVINLLPFVPISKAQGGAAGGAMLPWLFNTEQQQLYRYYMKLRYRLHPYLYSAAIEASQTGRPIMASLVFDYQDDINTYTKDYEFMLGRNILVAPVLDKSETWDVYLPKGKWIHYWTGKEYTGGGTVTVSAPLYGKDGLPMFVKAGAIIPMMPQMSYIYEKAPDPITLDIYPQTDSSSSYVMYDCRTVRSPVRQTAFKCIDNTKTIVFSASPSDVAYELLVHYDKQPVSVSVNSFNLPRLKDKSAYDSAERGWYYGTDCFYGSDKIKTVNIKIGSRAGAHVVRIMK
ncbi:MAG: TIM-barrel domain-containing protein [Planctomycetota bacterium]